MPIIGRKGKTMSKISINMDSLKEQKEYTRFKIADGDNIYRVLPPFGEDSNGYPYKKWSYVWLNDPNTGRRRPYASPYHLGDDKCPVKEYADALAAKIKVMESDYTQAGFSEAQIKDKLKPVRSEQWRLKLTHGYAYNVADKSGKNGILEIKKTAHDGVKKKLGEYIKDYGQDPTSLNSDVNDSGVWLNIHRSGKGTDTKYEVSFNQTIEKDANGRTIRVDDRSPLSVAIVNGYEEDGYDLTKLYTPKSYDELKEILIANLLVLAENGNKEYDSIPDLLLPGFDEAAAMAPPTEDNPVVNDVGPNVGLKLDGDEGGAPEDEITPTLTVSSTTVSSTTEDDLFKMADSILES